MKINYIIITSDDIDDFLKKVNSEIEKGYIPIQGFFVLLRKYEQLNGDIIHGYEYYQPMINKILAKKSQEKIKDAGNEK